MYDILENPAKEEIVKVTAGLKHAIALTKWGKMMSMGVNEDGQLGVDDFRTKTEMGLIPFNDRVDDVISGPFHTMCWNKNNVWMWGLGSDYQLGTGERGNKEAPTLIPNLSPPLSVGLGWAHSTVVNRS